VEKKAKKFNERNISQTNENFGMVRKITIFAASNKTNLKSDGKKGTRNDQDD